jgi:hypothetical protein
MQFDKQMAFDTAARHLLTQNEKSMTPESAHLCAYRGVNGRKCAIGALIPDNLYHAGLEGRSVVRNASGLQALNPMLGRPTDDEDKAFLIYLQKVHDVWTPPMWPRKLRDLAAQFKLHTEVLREFGHMLDRERLLKLAFHLENNVKKRAKSRRRRVFSMDYWWRKDADGTVYCCALGEATNIVEFRAAGLLRGTAGFGRMYEIWYDSHEGLSAAEEFFGLSSAQARYIFLPASYISGEEKSPVEIHELATKITPGFVARRIFDFVKTNGVIPPQSEIKYAF